MAIRRTGLTAAAKSPSRSARATTSASFCVVGLGASAGGLDAYRQVLAAMPADTGLGFVVVQHMAADHASSLAEILARSTTMPVVEVRDEPRVEGNRVYVIPPGKTMVISGRTLKLLPRDQAIPHHSIDLFFKSLADDQGHTSIGVVLSGTGNDGTAGLREIKSAGGITFAQDDTAQHDGMPRSAIAAQCVDFVLPPQRIAEEIARIARHPYIAPPVASTAPAADDDSAELKRILDQLQRITQVDFASYKPGTLRRRIARRMMLHGLEALSDYEHLLGDRPEEAASLFQDFLIGVTGFFRDSGTFDTVKRELFPRLFANRSRSEPLRIWVTGCSTGEEAYSFAIAAAEFMEEAGLSTPIQVFASDLNGGSIEKARSGVYPKSIARDVSASRLRRYFVEVDGSYRIGKAIRDTCVFATHNLLRDPPFSRLDLISCRNVLIYLGADLQKKLVPQLHYALKPAGYLVLGNSETISAHRKLFETRDHKHKIYRKIGGPGTLAPSIPRDPHVSVAAKAMGDRASSIPKTDVGKEADRLLLARYAPGAVLVDDNLDILQFRGDTSAFLTPASGRASLNLLKMARPGLTVPLRNAVLKAKQKKAAIREERVRLKVDGAYRLVSLEVVPLSDEQKSGFLVVMEDCDAVSDRSQAVSAKGKPPGAPASEPKGVRQSAKERAARLEQELDTTREYLESVIEQQEVVNEELQSANEEAQSANEELQSVNEELETSKEEIQSTNEELTTLNDELQHRNHEMARLNNDLVNLFASMDIAIVIVGRDLRIRRFTPLAEKLMHLGPDDVGRPLTDMRSTLLVPELDQIVTEVVDLAADREMEVQDRGGRWYRLRVRPYKTIDARIDGAILVLVDIDSIKRAREFAENIVSTVREPLVVLDHELRVRSASPAFYDNFGLSQQDTQNRPLFDIGDGGWNSPALRKQLYEVLSEQKSFENFELEIRLPGAGSQMVLVNAREIVQGRGLEPLILMSIEIATQRRQLHDSMRQVVQLSEADRNRNEFLAMLAHELRNPLAPLQNALHMLRSPLADEGTRAKARDMMERQIRIMTRLVDDLLDSARITQGKIGLFRETVDLKALLQRIVQSGTASTDRKQQTVSLSLPEAAVNVNGDATRLEQSFSNLLNNASKFSPSGAQIGVSAELVRTNPGENAPNEVVVRLRDNGIGISPATLPYIFDLFMQSDRSLDRPEGGLGIGLTLTRKLLELQGGTIEARSDGLGHGSEFIVRLPVVASDKVGIEAGEAATAAAVSKRDILIVDDNMDAADSLTMMLRLAGHEVATSYSAADALQKAAQMRPEVIILDIGLPEMNGYALARKMRGQAALKDAVFIALTGYGRHEDRKRSAEAGFDHHLTKPVDYEALRGIIEIPASPPPH